MPDLKNWLKYEPKPMESWNTVFFSSTYKRGENLSDDQFLDLCNKYCTDYFKKSVLDNKFIPIVWHKDFEPGFLKNSKFINVHLDEKSLKWYHRAVWFKMYDYSDGIIHRKTHDLNYTGNRHSKFIAQYSNEVYVKDHPINFIKNNICKSTQKNYFSNTFKLSKDNQFILNLSQILSESEIISEIDKICNFLKIEHLSHKYIKKCHSHWIYCHDFRKI